MSALNPLPKINEISRIPMVEIGICDQPVWSDAGHDPQLAFDLVWAMYHADLKSCPSLGLCQHPVIDWGAL